MRVTASVVDPVGDGYCGRKRAGIEMGFLF